MTVKERDKLAIKSRDPEILDQLSQDKDEGVRQYVAMNPNTSVEILIRLIMDEDVYVRGSVAENPSTPVEMLAELSRDEDNWVRYYVAKNPNTPVETLAELSRDEDVRQYVAENPKWQVLQESGGLDVARLASKWLKIL